jgi:hypothetical protein
VLAAHAWKEQGEIDGYREVLRRLDRGNSVAAIRRYCETNAKKVKPYTKDYSISNQNVKVVTSKGKLDAYESIIKYINREQ